MGANISKGYDITQNQHLLQFVGGEHLPPSDNEFWETFLQYQINQPSNSQEQTEFDTRFEEVLQKFIINNRETGNYGTLVLIFIKHANELLSVLDDQSAMNTWKTFNALFIIRTIAKYMLETGSECLLLEHFEATPSLQTAQPPKSKDVSQIDMVATSNLVNDFEESRTFISDKLKAFIEILSRIIISLPVNGITYHLHLEAVSAMIVLLSVHLRPIPESSKINKEIYDNKYANSLACTLLNFVVDMQQVPQTMFEMSTSGSFVLGIAESFLSMFTFRKPHHVFDATSSAELSQQFQMQHPLANQSLLLLLVLLNHNTTKENAYRTSIFNCQDQTSGNEIESTFLIDFQKFYNALCRIVNIDQSTLLLYLMLHRNHQFNRFIMSQENIQNLVVPILRTLYNAPESTSHHIYMCLIVLLIFSEDDNFNKRIHLITLKNITWYTERPIAEISLGGLLILVVIRTIQYNMLKMRDKYLHTNCLAALANMSGHFRHLHPYVAQRLISLFEVLAKKYTKYQHEIKQSTEETINIDAITFTDDMMQDLNALEEVLRMILEILNSCLSNQLVHCPNLVYTLLYKRQVFEGLKSYEAFQDIIQNIDMVVGFFSSRLQRVQEQNGDVSVTEVLYVISKGASQWSNDRLRKFPDLKFKYVEEDVPEEFFIPYVWTLVCKQGSIFFNCKSIKEIAIE